MLPESKSGFLSSPLVAAVTVCAPSSSLTNVTVDPTGTVSSSGLYAKSLVCTTIGAALAAAVALLAPPANAAGSQVFAMTAQNGSGENGAVVLTPLGNKTRVMIALANAPAAAIQPAHFHVGPCATLTAKPTYPLKTVDEGI